MTGAPPAVLVALYCVVGLLPLAFVVGEGGSYAGIMRMAVLGSGMVAAALLLMQFMSSGRYEVLSGAAGIDRMMRFHQLAARTLTALALLHPLLLLIPDSVEALRDVPSRAAALFMLPHLLSGTIAWVLLPVLMVMGILRNRLPLRYELWRATHTALAVVIAGAALHHVATVGSYGSTGWLAGYWWILGALAFGTLAYLYLMKPFLLARRAYRVTSNREIGTGIRELVLEPARGKAMHFEAGQFAWVLLDQPPVTLLDHPFSLSSAPTTLPEVRLLIKARGDFTRSLHRIRVGAPAYLDGPHGNFTLRGRRGATLALIAGGIGIAPVMSLLRQLRADGETRPIGVLYGARNERQLVHADEIRAAAGTLDLQWQFFVDEPTAGWDGGVGELTLAAVRAAIRGDPRDCLCFLCGPTPMMLASRERLLACGVPAGRIVFERFDYD
jgi:predicted ferric reductase